MLKTNFIIPLLLGTFYPILTIIVSIFASRILADRVELLDESYDPDNIH